MCIDCLACLRAMGVNTTLLVSRCWWLCALTALLACVPWVLLVSGCWWLCALTALLANKIIKDMQLYRTPMARNLRAMGVLYSCTC